MQTTLVPSPADADKIVNGIISDCVSMLSLLPRLLSKVNLPTQLISYVLQPSFRKYLRVPIEDEETALSTPPAMQLRMFYSDLAKYQKVRQLEVHY